MCRHRRCGRSRSREVGTEASGGRSPAELEGGTHPTLPEPETVNSCFKPLRSSFAMTTQKPVRAARGHPVLCLHLPPLPGGTLLPPLSSLPQPLGQGARPTPCSYSLALTEFANQPRVSRTHRARPDLLPWRYGHRPPFTQGAQGTAAADAPESLLEARGWTSLRHPTPPQSASAVWPGEATGLAI